MLLGRLSHSTAHRDLQLSARMGGGTDEPMTSQGPLSASLPAWRSLAVLGLLRGRGVGGGRDLGEHSPGGQLRPRLEVTVSLSGLELGALGAC